MRRSFFLTFLLAVSASILFSAIPLVAQTTPAAREDGLPLVIGGGMADNNIDFGAGRRMEGIAVWAGWDLTGHKFVPRGLTLDVEGKTIRYGLPQGFSQMREETALGGVLYSWRHYKNFRPYAKGLMGIGSIDFPPYPNYGHDTRMVKAMGGGIEYRAYRNVWIRADYEYQMWEQLFGTTNLTPNGFTMGASYDFKRLHGGR
jgi:opacity protein-like surface antigen